MPVMKRYYLEDRIEKARARFDWLNKLNPPHRKIVNFGCDIGEETFQIMWALDADEAVGIDIDESDIEAAKQTLEQIMQDVCESKEAFNLAMTKQEDREWWIYSVPECMKNDNFPEFFVADMTQQTDLPGNHFDIAYCWYVLNHIDGSKVPQAIAEMKRVVRDGGWIVAVEPVDLPDGTPLDFSYMFRKAELGKIMDFDDGYYLYRKESAVESKKK